MKSRRQVPKAKTGVKKPKVGGLKKGVVKRATKKGLRVRRRSVKRMRGGTPTTRVLSMAIIAALGFYMVGTGVPAALNYLNPYIIPILNTVLTLATNIAAFVGTAIHGLLVTFVDAVVPFLNMLRTPGLGRVKVIGVLYAIIRARRGGGQINGRNRGAIAALLGVGERMADFVRTNLASPLIGAAILIPAGIRNLMNGIDGFIQSDDDMYQLVNAGTPVIMAVVDALEQLLDQIGVRLGRVAAGGRTVLDNIKDSLGQNLQHLWTDNQDVAPPVAGIDVQMVAERLSMIPAEGSVVVQLPADGARIDALIAALNLVRAGQGAAAEGGGGQKVRRGGLDIDPIDKEIDKYVENQTNGISYQDPDTAYIGLELSDVTQYTTNIEPFVDSSTPPPVYRSSTPPPVYRMDPSGDNVSSNGTNKPSRFTNKPSRFTDRPLGGRETSNVKGSTRENPYSTQKAIKYIFGEAEKLKVQGI